MNKFTKADLKPNMIVEYRNGEHRMVYDFEGELILADIADWDTLSEHDDNLLSATDNSLDIVEVKKATSEQHFVPIHWDEAPTIWERKEMPKLTKVERVILENALINGKVPKWIARDRIGDSLLVVTEKTKLTRENGYWDSWFDLRYLQAFDHLFQFVKWEDGEPWYIPDLLEESED